ncbi:MAG TPA: RNA polymerase sigma factor [Elusimicrobiota bacterium]|jgi:RNA polymerase sigma-70 factor (ECF subfamily)|nr:RNA polymerase sigma factor [Elusimicrobiota bacterium]
MAPPVSEEIQALKKRDNEAVRRLVADHSGALLAGAMSMGFCQADAEELVQDTFVAFLEGVERFEGRSSVKTFLFGILYNKGLTLRRRQRKEEASEKIEEIFDARFGALGVWTTFPRGPEHEALNAELKAWLEDCAGTLTSEQRAALHLKEVEGEETSAICRILEVTANNLGVLLFRARNKMRECLEGKSKGGEA